MVHRNIASAQHKGSGAKPTPLVVSPSDHTVTRGTLLDNARWYAEMGWSVVPLCCPSHTGNHPPNHAKTCTRPGKQPVRKLIPLRDKPFTIDDLVGIWKRNALYNVGVLTGRISRLIIIDVDSAEAHTAYRHFLGAADVETWRFASGRGQPHYLYRWPFDFAPRGKPLEDVHPQIDFIGEDMLSVMPPSLHKSGNVYRWLEGGPGSVLPIAECPAPLLERLREKKVENVLGKEDRPRGGVVLEPTPDPVEKQHRRAVAYLRTCEPAISGQGGRLKTFKIACKMLFGFGLTELETVNLMSACWNNRCVPPWTLEELQKEVEGANTRGSADVIEERPLPDCPKCHCYPCDCLSAKGEPMPTRATTASSSPPEVCGSPGPDGTRCEDRRGHGGGHRWVGGTPTVGQARPHDDTPRSRELQPVATNQLRMKPVATTLDTPSLTRAEETGSAPVPMPSGGLREGEVGSGDNQQRLSSGDGHSATGTGDPVPLVAGVAHHELGSCRVIQDPLLSVGITSDQSLHPHATATFTPPLHLNGQAHEESEQPRESPLTSASTTARRVPSKSGPALVTFDEVKTNKLEWLWPGRIPLGAMTMLDGKKSMGKSTLLAAIAADVSGGPRLPGPDTAPRRLGRVLWCAAEENITITPKLRLIAAGAVLGQITPLGRNADGKLVKRYLIPDHLEEIRDLIREHDVALLVLDPWISLLPPSHSAKDEQSIRAALEPLAEICFETRCSVVMARHLRKSGNGPAIDQGLGSTAIGNLARSVLLICADSNNPHGRILTHVACNDGPLAPSVLYQVRQLGEAGRIVWGHEISKDAEDVLAESNPSRERGTREMARHLLRQRIGDGWVKVKDIQSEAEMAAISRETLINAKKDLNCQHRRKGGLGETGWFEWGPPVDGWPPEGDQPS